MTLAFAFLSMLLSLFSEEATIVFAGDAMQHQVQLDNARRADGTYSYTDCFDKIAPWVTQADYAVVNLETTLGQGGFTGYPCFCSPDSYARALRDAGFDLFLTANNHTLDRRDRGLRRTAAMLDSLGVDHIGTYTDARQRSERLPLIKDIKGFKVAFLNYTYGTNGIKIQGDVVVDYIDRQRIAADIKACRRAGAELVIVMPHWGIEYQLINDASQRALARHMLESGADAVIGGHPHVIQPMKMTASEADSLGRRPVVYSMGNFISGMRTEPTRGGAMVQLTLSRGAAGRARIKDGSYRLVFTLPGTPGKQGHRLIFVDEDTDIAAEAGAMAPQCRAFTRSALGIFGKHNVDFPRYEPHDDPLGLDDVLRLIINELGTYSRMCTQTDRRI